MTSAFAARPGRRGAILLVVLALLTLFAVVGLAFVLYANGQARAAHFAREAQNDGRPDLSPEQLLAFFLGQFLYDVPDDEAGVYSTLRGHSLARSMYGHDDAGPNDIPFHGTGRLHYGSVFEGLDLPNTPAEARDDYYLVNYTFFRADGLLRDPERLGHRRDLTAAWGAFRGGCNASYTYPDLNNLYLGAVKADGTVLLPSFHRPWLFGPNDRHNPNWTNTAGKYLLLRPRPADMGPGFPYPEDDGGDVKNLVGGPGGNDSYWLDLGFPVMTTPDGRKFKPLFAPLVTDLDNRVNVNVHGNIRGAGQMHRSNQGWGPWEVNLGRVLTRGNEVSQLLAGTATPPLVGRYGRSGPGLPPANVAAFPGPPPFYARIDYDASDEADGGVTPPLRQLLGGFPTFPQGFGNASPAECADHPAVYNVRTPTDDDRAFAVSNLEALLRYGDTGSPALTSELLSLCPLNFGADPSAMQAAARRRRLVTTLSFDVDRPAVTPWVWDPAAQPYTFGSGSHPQGLAIPFPAATQPGNPPVRSEFGTDWRARTAALGRVNLNRPLPAYPTADVVNGFLDREAFLAAQVARVRLAQEVFDRLRAATGAADPALVPPASPEYDAVRWLAQLAVNVVDTIDADDYLTPFNWFATEWVFGTELPRVLLNEVYAEYSELPGTEPPEFQVRVWAELHNPLSADPVLSDGGAAVLTTASQPAYQLVLSRPDANLRQRANVLGTPQAPHRVVTFPAVAAVVGPQGFLVAGPPQPFPDGAFQATLQTPDMTYRDGDSGMGLPAAPTLLLRRLACPHRPHSDAPGPDYNPYVTVDYLEPHRALGFRLNRDDDPLGRRLSFGRSQPYAADPLQLRRQQGGQIGQVQHTFLRPNQPAAASFDWLVHLDRPLISPMELLRVSAFKPHELTQQFMLLNQPSSHEAPWLNGGSRLYRVFEFLETLPRAAGMPAAPGGRVPGKVNINTIWDPETLLALCDPQPSNNFTAADLHNPDVLGDPHTVFGRLLATRTPGLIDGDGPGRDDRPFLGLATGTTPPGDRQYPNGLGIEDTILRSLDGRLLFQTAEPPPGNPNRHPYLQQQLLTKVFNQLTTRSNVFAVWLTVGFFEVTDETARPVKLGAEVGRAEGRHVRRRMFAVVDRSVLTHNPGPQPLFKLRGESPGTDPQAPPDARAAVPYFSIIQ